MKPQGLPAVIAATSLLSAGVAQAELVNWYLPGDTPYLSTDDSPWVGTSADMEYFYLEDFEDGLLNTPGLDASIGVVRAPWTATDSVDADDGVIDGFGREGYSFWRYEPDVAPSITFTFELDVLGLLPTNVGLVWTDGNDAALVTFEVFDADGLSLGSFQTMLGDGYHSGGTAADRFLGAEYALGISAMTISAEFGGLEVDHIHYGASVVPAPSAAVAVLLGLGIRRGRRRR
ncbi:MAG: hypothetical protein JSV91_14015 [Phycisphaerales bacterium]|nr:MAG: hypothetical protein JSV91_14015 [Phycisphaerales bacterium]